MNTRQYYRVLSLLCASFALHLAGSVAYSQSTTSGSVVGTVTDPSSATVPHCTVLLLNMATNATATQTTGAAGEFTFSNVVPGAYRVTVSMPGFRTSTIENLTVDVNESVNVPVHLEVGAANQVVEVSASATAQLQTQDAQLGNVVSTGEILRLPTLQRNATELMNLQPGVVAGGNGLMMRVSGAIDDQNTVTLDGIDITQTLVATGTSIPTPADSVEEFRETVANPSATLMRGSGAQVSLIGRRGSSGGEAS